MVMIMNLKLNFHLNEKVTVSIFRIFANSANKRQTTVTMNQILTQKWFLLQNIKNESYFRNGVFNN
jgi:hypothetical protein